jgi:outer membrane murein-binding lipoprotein Lpp
MKKNMLKIVAVLMSLTLLAACSNKENGTPGVSEDTVKQLEEKIVSLEADNAALKEENEALKVEIEELKASGSGGELIEEEEEELPVFSADEDGTMTQVITVVVKTDEPLLNKMQMLGDKLSEEVFEGLAMKAVEIKEENGKDILYVDLIEGSGEVGAKSWIFDYFQGTTGGNKTETALAETFLQREYGGVWVDGVHFTLDGEKIEFDHVPNLADTIMR